MSRRGLLVITLLAACGGDDGAGADASNSDAPHLDASTFPAAPTLGPAIDRMGRPAITTALNALLETNAIVKAAKKDAYNHASDPGTWATTVLDANVQPAATVRSEFAGHLGMFDALDSGMTVIGGNGCGNAPAYAAPAGPTSYHAFANLLADDQLYLDTSKTQCDRYLAVELAAVFSTPQSGCGGRTLTHDVIDTTYSLMAAGAYGFDSSMNPRIGDGVSAHTDVTNLEFPFLGQPR